MVSENQMSNVGKGFTLPELLIAISIFVLVSMIAVVSFRSFDSSSRLRGTRDAIINDLQDMQSWARNGRLVNFCQDASGTPESGKGICIGDSINGCSTAESTCCTSSTYICKPGLPTGGYGIYFDQTNKKYVLFADIFNSGSDLGCGNSCVSGTAEILLGSERSLPSSMGYNISYYRYSYESGFTTHSNNFPVQVIFQNDGKILIKDNSALNSTSCVEKIGICNLNGSLCETSNYIYVNSISGLIYGDSDHLEAAGSP